MKKLVLIIIVSFFVIFSYGNFLLLILHSAIKLRNTVENLTQDQVFLVENYKLGNDFELYWGEFSTEENNNSSIFKIKDSSIKRRSRIIETEVDVRTFGVKCDSKTASASNVIAIENAIKHASKIVFPPCTIYIDRKIELRDLNDKTIITTGSIIKNINKAQGTIQFYRSNNITIVGGLWTREGLLEEGKSDEMTFRIIGCNHVRLDSIHIDGSPEGGVCLMGVIDAVVNNCRIENCFRDGIYSQYSYDLKYINNTLINIKDDAMSVHDYGRDREKPELIKLGVMQAGHALISGNIVRNAMEGFASIGSQDLIVTNNTFENIVNAGIHIFNSKTLWPDGNAKVRNITIDNNSLIQTGGLQTIIKRKYYNEISSSSYGRSAIIIASRNESNQLVNPVSSDRIKNITVSNNVIKNCYVNGAYLANIDGVTFKNNSFIDCNISQYPNLGKIVEVNSCTQALIDNNSVIDSRVTPKTICGYEINQVTGIMKGWKVTNCINKSQGYILNSPFLSK